MPSLKKRGKRAPLCRRFVRRAPNIGAIMALYSITAWLYMAFSMVFTPSMCILCWRTLLIAKSKRRFEFVTWLRPTAIGTTVFLGAILCLALRALLFRRDVNLMSLSYIFATTGSIFNLVGFLRLWKFVRALP